MGKEIREVTSPEMLKKSAKINGMLSRPAKRRRSSRLSLYLTRLVIARLYRSVPIVNGVRFSRITLGKTRAISAVCEEGSTCSDIIVYIHGGAFMSGSASSTKGYASALAKHSGCKVYSIDYPLSPEVLFPVALNECIDAVETLIRDNPGSKLTLIGDSAGGNLSLAVALKMKESGKIGCLVLNSPVIDFSDTIDRARYNKDSIVVKKGLKSSFKKLYIGDHDEKDPVISPYFGDFSGLPPVFLTCDSGEGLYADSLYVYEKCEEHGIRSHLVAMKGAFHAFAVMGDSVPETKQLMSDYLAFMKEAIASGPAS